MLKPLLSALLLALALPNPGQAAEYAQAAGSSLVFATEYQGEVFVGKLPDFSSRIDFDPEHPERARFDVTIPLSRATVDNPEGDEALKGQDFFHLARFPEARYTAAGARALGDGRYATDGRLTLRGLTKPVTLTFRWTVGPRPVLEGQATVHRLQFDVGGGDWADTDLIPDAVAVSTKLLLEPAPSAAPLAPPARP